MTPHGVHRVTVEREGEGKGAAREASQGNPHLRTKDRLSGTSLKIMGKLGEAGNRKQKSMGREGRDRGKDIEIMWDRKTWCGGRL